MARAGGTWPEPCFTKGLIQALRFGIWDLRGSQTPAWDLERNILCEPTLIPHRDGYKLSESTARQNASESDRDAGQELQGCGREGAPYRGPK